MSGSFEESTATSAGNLRVRLERLGRLTLKELREILRDRRTIITLLLMPILLYPLLSLAFQKLLLTGLTGNKPVLKLRIGISADEADFISETLVHGHRSLPHANESETEGNDEEDAEPQAEYFRVHDVDAAVKAFDVDLGIRVLSERRPQVRPDRDVAVDFELVYAEGSPAGTRALDYVQDRLRAISEEILRARLHRLSVKQRVMPLRMVARGLKGEGRGGAISLASLVPVILILMTITGAVYPAIDLTAGEREGGTLETLVAAPVPRLSLLFAKYVAVIAVACLTAIVNLISMAITLLTSGLGEVLWGKEGLPAITVLEVFALLLLFAAFFSAVLLTLTSFARSFKEAQAYLIPLMLFSLSPGLISLVPGIKLSGWLLITPLLNIALLSRDLLEGTADPISAAVVVISTALFALAAISLAAHIFGSESVLYDSLSGWADLFWKPAQVQAAPRLSSALMCLALMFPACFLLTNTLARLKGTGTGIKLGIMSAGTALIFGLLPVFAASREGVRWTSGFRIHKPPLVAIPAVLLLGLCLWPFAFELTVLTHDLGFTTISSEHSAQVKGLIEQFRSLSPLLVLFAMALVPALFEEFFFRGYLFSALLAYTRPRNAILASALFFGLFHLITTDALAVERLLPTTFLGLVLGWVCWKTGSLIPGIVLHCVHNGFLTMVAFYERELSARGWGGGESRHLPILVLVGAAVGCAVGLGLIQTLRPEPPESEKEGALPKNGD